MRRYKNITKTVGILLVIFFLSVIPRIPNINRPLSEGFEYVTAHSLITLQIWDKEGISKYNYTLVSTFNNLGDKWQKGIGSVFDRSGNRYYVSYPPTAIIIPYSIFRLFNIKPDVLPLQIFNLCLHFLSALLVYFTINKIINTKTDEQEFCLAAGLGFVVYLFLPLTMWYQSNIYFVDTFVQTIWILGVYVITVAVKEFRLNDSKTIGLIGIVTFLMVYSEWIGVFYAFTILIYLFYKRSHIPLAITLIIASLFAVILFIFQNASIIGMDDLLIAMKDRLEVRSVNTTYDPMTSWYSPYSYIRIAQFYLQNYLPTSLLLIVFFSIIVASGKINITDNEKTLLFFSISPVIMHHTIFFSFTAIHEFSILSSALAISVTTAILYSKAAETIQENRWIKWKMLVISLLILTVISDVYVYRNANRFTLESPMTPHPKYLRYKELGEKIAATSNKEDLIACIGLTGEGMPQTCFYAKRNVVNYESIEDVKSVMKEHGHKSAMIYYVTTKMNIDQQNRVYESFEMTKYEQLTIDQSKSSTQ